MRKQYYTLLILLCTTSTFIFSMEINRDVDNRSEVSELSGDETVPYNKLGLEEQLLATKKRLKNAQGQLVKTTNQLHHTRELLGEWKSESRDAYRESDKKDRCLKIYQCVNLTGIYCCGALAYFVASSSKFKKSK